MKRAICVFVTLFLAGCLNSYAPPAAGPTATLKVEPDVKSGTPLVSTTQVVLRVEEELDEELFPGIKKTVKLFTQKIDLKNNPNTFVIPADKRLQVSLSYSNVNLGGPTMTGSRGFLLVPEQDATYVAQFWSDRVMYTVALYEESPTGELVAANAPVIP